MVLFEPFGEEKKCAYRMLVRLARACATKGIATLRVDLSGTGESAESHKDANFANWCADAKAAVQLVLKLEGIDSWWSLGTRFGALLAAETAKELPPSALSLLEPALSGSELLWDLERRQKIKDMMAGKRDNSAPSAAERWQVGETLDFGGFAVNPTLATQLEEADLQANLALIDDQVPLHLVRVSGGKKFPPAWDSLVKRAELAEIIADKPFWGQLEYYESDMVIDAGLALAKRMNMDAEDA